MLEIEKNAGDPVLRPRISLFTFLIANMSFKNNKGKDGSNVGIK